MLSLSFLRRVIYDLYARIRLRVPVGKNGLLVLDDARAPASNRYCLPFCRLRVSMNGQPASDSYSRAARNEYFSVLIVIDSAWVFFPFPATFSPSTTLLGHGLSIFGTSCKTRLANLPLFAPQIAAYLRAKGTKSHSVTLLSVVVSIMKFIIIPVAAGNWRTRLNIRFHALTTPYFSTSSLSHPPSLVALTASLGKFKSCQINLVSERQSA